MADTVRLLAEISLGGRALSANSQIRPSRLSPRGPTLGAVRVLCIAAETPGREDLCRELVLDDWDVVVASRGREGLARATGDAPDAIVLDADLPDMDGVQMCKLLRRSGVRTPVLMLTDDSELSERIACLSAGADDYMCKPYASAELRARLRSLVRRCMNGSWDGTLRFEELELDAAQHVARVGERTIRLTRTEFQLLELFMLNPRRVLSPDVIYDRVWGYDFGSEGNALRVYMGYLRRKLEAGGERRLLQTLRGVGYVLREP
jgi:two-component system, OmpR family, response regulator MprA